MPLPEPTPVLSSAPRWAGVGLRAQLWWEKMTRPPASWTEDWWQRNWEELYELDTVGGWIPQSDRSFNIPPPPP